MVMQVGSKFVNTPIQTRPLFITTCMYWYKILADSSEIFSGAILNCRLPIITNKKKNTVLFSRV